MQFMHCFAVQTHKNPIFIYVLRVVANTRLTACEHTCTVAKQRRLYTCYYSFNCGRTKISLRTKFRQIVFKFIL